jgi:tape measure domain-containing protein
MPEINASYDLDISKVAGAFSRVEEMGKKAAASVNGGGTAFRGQTQGATRAAKSFGLVKVQADAAGASAAKSTGLVGRFFGAIRNGARAAAAISAIIVALVALNRRFPVIGQVAARSFAVIRQTATAAMVTTGKFAVTLENLKKAAGAAVGIYALAKAFRALRGSASGTENIKAPKAPSAAGGMGFGMKAGIAGAVLGAAALGTMVFATVKDGMTRAITQAAEMEQIEIGFEVLTGGPQQAKQLLGEIKTLAANTPLSFGDLAQAGRQLAAFKEPLETLPDTLRRIGDISSGIGAPIGEIAELYGKARVQGTLFAEDINQLTGRGIDVISEFATQLGVSTGEVKKLASEGKISFSMLEQAFANMTDEGGTFEDMMERQSKTVAGLWSTLKDNVTMAITAMGAPINDAIRPILAKAIELTESFGAHFDAVGQRIAGVINFIHAAFTELSGGEMLTALGDALQLAFMKALDLLARGFQAIFASANDAGFMDTLGEKLRSMGVILKDVLLAAVQAVLSSMGEIKGLGFLSEAADGIGVQRGEDKLKEARRRNEKSDEEPVDLLAELRKSFDGAEGIFGPAIQNLESGLKQKLEPVFAEAARLLAEQQSEASSASGTAAAGAGAGAGETVASAAGAFQQAKNLISGKTVNEMVAQEAAKTNEKLDGVTAAINENTKAVKDNGYKPGKEKTKVAVDLVW